MEPIARSFKQHIVLQIGVIFVMYNMSDVSIDINEEQASVPSLSRHDLYTRFALHHHHHNTSSRHLLYPYKTIGSTRVCYKMVPLFNSNVEDPSIGLLNRLACSVITLRWLFFLQFISPVRHMHHHMQHREVR